MSLCSVAAAHNVVSGVYADGMNIEGEIGFSSGLMAESGVMVEVFNEVGEKLGETQLDDNGQFMYTAKTVQKHIFKANLSAGHIAEVVMEADELSDAGSASAVESVAMETSTGVAPAKGAVAATNGIVVSNAGTAISVDELQSLIRSAVAQQVRPLQKELSAYKEKVMLRDITGGLGFIFGLFGVAAWAASRRKTGAQ